MKDEVGVVGGGGSELLPLANEVCGLTISL
jgi:hypothetical protein